MGSRLASIVRLADETITVADLVSGQDLYAVGADWPAADAAAALVERDYRWAPVSDEPITRFVAAAELADGDGTVADGARDIPGHLRLGEHAPLTDFIDHLRDHDLAFVTHRGRVTGILTTTDIQHPAVGLYAFGMISALESGLDQLIERHTGGQWQHLLSPDRLEKVLEVRDERRRVDLDAGLQTCLNLDDRLTLARKVDAVHDAVGFDSKQRFRQWMRVLKRVRNGLAHGNNVLDAVPDVADALAFLEQLREVTVRVWAHVDGDTPVDPRVA